MISTKLDPMMELGTFADMDLYLATNPNNRDGLICRLAVHAAEQGRLNWLKYTLHLDEAKPKLDLLKYQASFAAPYNGQTDVVQYVYDLGVNLEAKLDSVYSLAMQGKLLR